MKQTEWKRKQEIFAHFAYDLKREKHMIVPYLI